MAPIDEPTMSRADVRRRNAYLKEFIPAMAAYVVTVTTVATLVDAGDPYAWAWMLLPMVPVLVVVHAIAKDLGRADEFSRLVQLQGMAAGFGLAMASALTVGFLGIAGVTTRAAGWIPFGCGMAGWAATSAALGRRSSRV